TGSIAATRELLGAIARLPRGAVVLPGLDLAMDKASWDSLAPEHPQFVLKQLLAHLEILRSDVEPFGAATPRAWLAGEIMRPLAKSGAAALRARLVDWLASGFTPDRLLALLRHDLCEPGSGTTLDVIELAVFGAAIVPPPLGALADSFGPTRAKIEADPHAHP